MAGLMEILHTSSTLAEAGERLRVMLVRDGVQPDNDLVAAMLVAGCGGDIVAVYPNGDPVNPLARKFAAEL